MALLSPWYWSNKWWRNGLSIVVCPFRFQYGYGLQNWECRNVMIDFEVKASCRYWWCASDYVRSWISGWSLLVCLPVIPQSGLDVAFCWRSSLDIWKYGGLFVCSDRANRCGETSTWIFLVCSFQMWTRAPILLRQKTLSISAAVPIFKFSNRRKRSGNFLDGSVFTLMSVQFAN